MKKIPVCLGDRSYDILVGAGVLASLPGALKRLKLGPDAIIVTNSVVDRLHGKSVAESLERSGFSVKVFKVEDSEKSKTATVAFDLVNAIARYASDKKPVIIALGGGVIGDLAGFVAAVYKRGVPFVQVPTTLLAQVDSSIGGKVGVDLPEGKNLLGAFYQPRLVVSDVALLSTLPARQIRNGLAEVVKYGVIQDEILFSFIEKNHAALLNNDRKALEYVVIRCAAIKALLIEQDEKETKGLRTILNFGHTLGHAIEAASGYERYQHGEAVALGMRAACALSCRYELMTSIEAGRIEALLTTLGLPETMAGVRLATVLLAMTFDKKFVGKKNRFVLARGIGRTIIKEGIPLPVIHKILKSLM